jgi:hypothetical protein
LFLITFLVEHELAITIKSNNIIFFILINFIK